MADKDKSMNGSTANNAPIESKKNKNVFDIMRRFYIDNVLLAVLLCVTCAFGVNLTLSSMQDAYTQGALDPTKPYEPTPHVNSVYLFYSVMLSITIVGCFSFALYKAITLYKKRK